MRADVSPMRVSARFFMRNKLVDFAQPFGGIAKISSGRAPRPARANFQRVENDRVRRVEELHRPDMTRAGRGDLAGA